MSSPVSSLRRKRPVLPCPGGGFSQFPRQRLLRLPDLPVPRSHPAADSPTTINNRRTPSTGVVACRAWGVHRQFTQCSNVVFIAAISAGSGSGPPGDGPQGHPLARGRSPASGARPDLGRPWRSTATPALWLRGPRLAGKRRFPDDNSDHLPPTIPNSEHQYRRVPTTACTLSRQPTREWSNPSKVV